jgi:hypothetical protein
MEVKTYTLHKLFLHHPTFDLVVYKCYFILKYYFELYLEFLKNITFLLVVLSLLSCQTHPFPFHIFQMAVYIIVMRGGAPVGLLIVIDPYIWPYE